MTEEIKHPTFKEQWKARKVVKKAKKIAVKKLVEDGMSERLAKSLVKKAADKYSDLSNRNVQVKTLGV